MHRLRSRLARGRFFGPGELRLALLALLDGAPAHGYELMTRLAEKSGGAYQPSAGAIYPTLQQLEDEALVKLSTTGAKKTYALTAAGKKECAERGDDIDAIWRRADSWSDWGVFQHPDGAEIWGPALRLAKAALKTVLKSRGDARVIDAVRDVFDRARREVEKIR
jgi:DNA-binding PadR family transcriptional regulator